MGDVTLAVAIMPAPVPNQEAEHYAGANYMWKDAVEVTKSHKAHLMVSVLGKDANLLERGKLFTKVVSSCLKQERAIAVYTDGTVFQSALQSLMSFLISHSFCDNNTKATKAPVG